MTDTKRAMLIIGLAFIFTAVMLWVSPRRQDYRLRKQPESPVQRAKNQWWREDVDGALPSYGIVRSPLTVLEQHVRAGVEGYSEVLADEGTPPDYEDAVYRLGVWFTDGTFETVTPRESCLMAGAYAQGRKHGEQRS